MSRPEPRRGVGPEDRFEKHSCESDPICPYCNAKQEDWWEVLPQNFCGDGEFDMDCGTCEREFSVTAEFSCGFSTTPKSCKTHAVESLQWSLYPRFREVDWDMSRGRSLYAPLVYKTLPPEERRWVLTSSCADCDALVSYIDLPANNIISLRDEYLDPDFFDPDGVLKVVGRDRYCRCGHCDWEGKRSELLHEEAYIDPDGETDFDEPELWKCPECHDDDQIHEALPPRKPTPILDAARETRGRWARPLGQYGVEQLRAALVKHEREWA